MNTRRTQTIKIQYKDGDIEEIKKIDVGDWHDLSVYSIEHMSGRLEGNVYQGLMHISAGDTFKIYFGVAMKLPEGYEAHIVPRGSTFRKKGFIQGNSIGIVDNSFSGPEDWWWVPVYATRDATIDFGEKLFQFRTMEKQPNQKFNTVDRLSGKSRGSDGSTDIWPNKSNI